MNNRGETAGLSAAQGGLDASLRAGGGPVLPVCPLLGGFGMVRLLECLSLGCCPGSCCGTSSAGCLFPQLQLS